MKTRRFDFNFKPLQISCNFSVDGSVPDKQNYDAASGEFTPDYTLTPLIIQPQIGRMDKDDFLPSGNINHELTNIKWYEIVGTTATKLADVSGSVTVGTLITTSNANYEITTSGAQAGRIKVKKNAQPNVPITLRFYAEYVDSRTNQIFKIQSLFPIECKNATKFAPMLLLDAADVTVFNPLVDQALQTVHASLRLGVDECEAKNRAFVWEVFRADNTWSAVGVDNMDYDVSVSDDGTSCTVDRSLMGEQLTLRCRAKYSDSGNPTAVTLNNAAPCKVVQFVRQIPKYDFDMMGLPVNIPSGLLAICPEAYIYDNNGEIPNPERELLPLWYVATNKASGSLSYTQVAHGMTPTIPTAAMSNLHGGVYGLDVVDVGPDVPWEDSDGYVFEDSDGNVILIK